MGMLSNISLEVISLEVNLDAVHLTAAAHCKACMLPEEKNIVLARVLEQLPYLTLPFQSEHARWALMPRTVRQERTAQLLTCRVHAWAADALQYLKQGDVRNTGNKSRQVPVLALPMSSIQFWGAMLCLSQSQLRITAFYAAKHTWQAQSLWKNKRPWVAIKA